MKIIILGAGAIGSLVGAMLSKDNDVVLIGNKEHVDKINKNGLEISGKINKNFKIKAETKISKIGDNDLIILTTKAYDNERAVKSIKNSIKKNNVILVLQNGLGNEEVIKKFAKCRVIRGITDSAATFLDPGKVKSNNIGYIYLEDSEKSKKIAEVLKKAGFEAEVISNIKEKIWQKLIVNCVINPLTAVFKVKNRELEKFPEQIRLLIRELISVARKEGMNFNEKETFDMVMKVIKDSGENQSSMLQDVLKGKKTEIDFLNGKIVKIAKKYGIKCPINQDLTGIINSK